MARTPFIEVFRFSQGFILSRPLIDAANYSRLDQVGPRDYAAAGSANCLFMGNGRPEVFKGLALVSGIGGSQEFQCSNGYASLGLKSVSAGLGSIFSYIGRSIFFIGAGRVLFNGAALTGNPDASTTLRFRLFDTGAYNGTTYTAGMTAPGSPTIAQGPVGTRLNGTYSVRLSAIRSTTGAESNASQSSPSISLANFKAAINFPVTVGNGHDKWGIYVTLANFGTKGPHYLLPPSLTGESPIGFVKESTVAAATAAITAITNANPAMITIVGHGFQTGQTVTIAGAVSTLGTAINGARVITVLTADTFSISVDTTASSVYSGTGATAAGRTLYFEWYDGDLTGQDLAPITNFIPPVGTHAFSLEGCIAVVGCYGDVTSGVSTGSPGNMIAVSRAGFPEAFPVDTDHLLAMPEPPTLVLTRAASGVVFIAGKNSLSVVRYTGASGKAPLALSTLWPDVGFATFTNACLADGVLYGFTASRGVVRMDSDNNPDYLFASGIARFFEGVPATSVCTGYDPATTMVVYGFTYNPGSGSVSRLICYNKGYGLWSAPINFEDLVAVPAGGPGIIKEMFTNAGQLYIVLDNGGSEYAVYQFHSGTGANVKLRSAWRDGGAPEKNKTVRWMKLATENASSNTITMDVYKNLDSTNKAATKAFTPSGAPQHLSNRIDIINAKTFMIHLEGITASATAIEGLLSGIVSDIDT